MAFEIAGLYTDEEIKAAGGPSSSTMTKFRRVAEGDDMPEPRGDTHRRIDTALGWPKGSSRELWHRQREPEVTARPQVSATRRAILEDPDLDEETRAALLELLDKRRPNPPQPPHSRHLTA